ncbi:unnamed protein product [Closterium sp. NIES-64]|nr:unnamed protein product [Closterium sp. NIES-64]CAI5966787.1 unnamed protein product [Closterium sp. NIES-64]
MMATLSFPPSLSRQEDTVLLRHALQCGTKQWGELGRSGQLKRSNKSCCNRYIFLRRKFTQQFRESFLRNHLGGAAFLQDVSLDGNSLPLFCQDFQQQQQQQQQQQEGAGSAALAFGGLSYEECTAVFFAPNARCCRQPASLNLSSVTSSPPHSQAASVCATAAASIAKFPVSHEASPVAAASNSAARRRALKRPRDDSPTLGAQPALLGGRESWFVPRGFVRGGVLRGGVVCGTEHGHQSVAEQFQQQGASSLMQQAADEALLEALLQEEHRQQQQGGARSRAQRVLWPRVGSESALPDDVLLGCNSDEPAFIQRSALSAPPPTLPLAALPAPMRPQLAALPASAPCIGDFAVQPVEWLRVGSESALPDDVLLGLCCEDPASSQRAALSAPAPAQPLAALMPSPLTGLPGPASGSATGCLTAMLVGSACGTQEQEYLDACIDVHGNITNTNNTDNCGKHSGKDNGALFLDTPMAHVLLAGSLLAMPLASGPHAEGPAAPHAAPRAAGTALPEWAVEQGGTGEGGAEGHRQQQFLGQEGMLAQGKPCQYLKLDRMLSLPPHQPQLHSQPPPHLLPKPLLKLPTQAPWLSAASQSPP